jgi:PEP-CTERM motif
LRTITARIIATALFAGLASSAGASVVVNNGLPNQSGGSDMNEFLEADDFTLGAASTSLNLVRFWSLQSATSDYAGSIEWSIRQDAAGTPGAVSDSGSATPTGVATGNTAFGFNEFRYEFAISTTLVAGNYWLALHNGPNSSQPTTSFYWEWSQDTGDSQSFDLPFPAQGWTGNFSELAFQLEAQDRSVPEPATIFLIGSGLAAMMTRRRCQVIRAT